MGRGAGQRVLPVKIAARGQRRGFLLALQNDATFDLVLGNFKRAINQGLVFDDARRLDPARGRDHKLGRGVIDALGEFFGGKAAKDDRMNRADAGGGQHGNGGFGHHGHINQDPVAFGDTLIGQRTGKQGDRVGQFLVGVFFLRAGDGRIVNQRGLIAASRFDMSIQTVIGGIAFPACEPARKWRL